MDGITRNISTINSVFELQVKSVNEQNEAMKSLAGAVSKSNLHWMVQLRVQRTTSNRYLCWLNR